MAEIKLQPLKGKTAIAELYKSGKRFHTHSATAFVQYSEYPNDNKSHILNHVVTISKRCAKKAVVRNRIKRLLRVSLNKMIDRNNTMNALSLVDSILISWKNAPKHPMLINLSDVIPVLDDLIRKIGSVKILNKQ